MTTKGKIIVGISALVILSGAGYLIYKFVIKPAQDKKKEPVLLDAPTTNNTISTGTSGGTNVSTNTQTLPATSKYGFAPKVKLYPKKDYTPVYSYPEYNKNIGYINKSAVSKIIFEGDAGTDGWIKVTVKYIPTGSSKEEIGQNIFMIASTVTNIAP